jgi:hypothetical protein
MAFIAGLMHAYGKRLTFAVAFGLLAVGGAWSGGAVRAQSSLPPANFSYVSYLPGWNLISSAGDAAADAPTLVDAISGPLFTFQPDARGYATTDLGHLKPGQGYWANFTKKAAIAYGVSDLDSTTLVIPAGQCAMVGNPSTKGSARVTGAERVYSFSAALNQYVDGSLIGLGRGAWACNDTRTSTVSVAFAGDVTQASWPDCCNPRPFPNRGMGHVIFANDSPSPFIVGLRQMQANGDYLDGGDAVRGEIDACPSCTEVSGAHQCSAGAIVLSFDMAPGSYSLHIQSEARNVADLQISISIDPDTQYSLCYFIGANRPEKNLP